MAVSVRAARDLRGALRLTPNQVVEFALATSRLRGETAAAPPVRYGTKDQFKAAVLGATGGR